MGPHLRWQLVTDWLLKAALFVAVGTPVESRANAFMAEVLTQESSAAAGQTARLAEILKQWEQHSTRRTRLDARFVRYRYDETLGVEYRGEGLLAMDRAGRAAYTITSAAIAPGTKSRKRTAGGGFFALLPEEGSLRWHWTDTEFIRIDENEHTMQVASRPKKEQHSDPAGDRSRPSPPETPHAAGPAQVNEAGPTFCWRALQLLTGDATWSNAYSDFWLPEILMLGGSAEKLQQAFHVTLLKETDTEFHLKFRPNSLPEGAPLKEVRLILGKAQLLPMAVLYEAPDRSQVVHRFLIVEPSRTGAARKPDHFPDLGSPNLSGLRKLEPSTP